MAAAAVTAAQWLAAQQQSQTSSVAHPPVLPHQSVGVSQTTESLSQQQATLQEQIRQSELNLSAQHSVSSPAELFIFILCRGFLAST